MKRFHPKKEETGRDERGKNNKTGKTKHTRKKKESRQQNKRKRSHEHPSQVHALSIVYCRFPLSSCAVHILRFSVVFPHRSLLRVDISLSAVHFLSCVSNENKT